MKKLNNMVMKTDGSGIVMPSSGNNTIANITLDELHEYVIAMANKISKANISGEIKAGTIVRLNSGYYEVQLSTNTDPISARPLVADKTYHINDYVYVIECGTAVNGSSEVSYFIFGLVNETNTAFANTSDLERFNAAGTAININETSYAFKNESDLNNFKNNTAIKITCDATTPADATSDFGVKIKFLNDPNHNDTEDGELIEELIFNSAYMQGQPQNMKQVAQVVVFERTCNAESFNKVIVEKFIGNSIAEGSISDLQLTLGTVNRYLKDFSVSIKPVDRSYWRNEAVTAAGQEVATFEAKLKYLDDDINYGVKYYWHVALPEGVKKVDLGEDNEEAVNALIGGDRWYCLNNFSETTLNSGAEVRIWDSNSNQVVLDKNNYLDNKDIKNNYYFDSGKKIPIKFVNKLRCTAVYEGFVVHSEEFDLIDYSKESFTIEISANQPDLSLITEDSEIILTCEVKQDNEMMKFTYDYLWIIDGETEFEVKKVTLDTSPVTGTTYYTYDSQLKQFNEAKNLTEFTKGVTYYVDSKVTYTKPTLKLKDTIANIYADNTYDLTSKEVKVKCRVFIDGPDADTSSDYVEDSNELTVTSFVFSESTINEHIFYKYLISGVNETFTSKLENGYLDWSSATSIANNTPSWISDPNLANWTGNTSGWPLTGATGAAAREHLNKIEFDENNSYLYYTTKSVWIEEKLDSQLAGDQRYIKIKEGDWSLPRMLRGVTANGNSLSEGAVNKINAFNDLTNGGQEQGFYLEDVYYPTEDDEPKSSKTYYLLTEGTYVKQSSLTEFEEDKTYYEYIENKLFINAEFIQTGALKVADENGNSVFYADIDQGNVEIAGFTIDENSISNNETDENKRLYFGTDGLYLGTGLQATVDESTGKVSVEIDGSVSISGSGNDTSLADVANRQLYSAYSSATTKPSQPQWTNSISSTDSTGQWHKTYNTETDFWICQKYASSYVGSGWGQVTQLEEIIPYNLSIENDYMVVTTDSDGKVGNESLVSLGTSGQQATVSCFRGIELVELDDNNITISGPERNGAYALDYADDGKATITIYNIEDDQEVWTISYKIGDVVFASSNIKVVKNKSGAQGEAGSTLQLKSSATTIKKIVSEAEAEDGSTVYTYTYEPNSVTFWLIQEKEGKETKVISGYDFYINNEKKTLTDGEVSVELTGSNSSLICQIKNSNALLIDQETITFVSDGEKGSDGLPGASVEETYYKYQIATDSANLTTEEWDIEGEIFSQWTGRDADTGTKTYVWKNLFAKLDNNDEVSGDEILIPEMEAIELAAKWQIKKGIYIAKNASTSTWQFPQLVTAETAGAVSILQPNLDDPTAETPIIPEGDIGRWCYLYNRTVISGGAIVTGSVTADNIATNAIEARHIKVDNLEAISGKMGTLAAGRIISENYSSIINKYIWNHETNAWEKV